MIPENMQKLLNQKIDDEKPGAGQHYCVTCSRYFISQTAQETHNKTKEHKKRFKVCQDVPYTIEEAERAGGLFNPKKSESKLAKLVAENESKMDE
jgi:bud site selection protein 20